MSVDLSLACRFLVSSLAALAAALAAGTVLAEPQRWWAAEVEAFGGIEGHTVHSPVCEEPCAPETWVRVECQGGTVA